MRAHPLYCSLNLLFSDVAVVVSLIGPLQDPVTWYGINYTGMQMTQWDFQHKGKSGWTGKSFFVLEVPLRHLRPSVIYSVPCDRILQRAILLSSTQGLTNLNLWPNLSKQFCVLLTLCQRARHGRSWLIVQTPASGCRWILAAVLPCADHLHAPN